MDALQRFATAIVHYFSRIKSLTSLLHFTTPYCVASNRLLRGVSAGPRVTPTEQQIVSTGLQGISDELQVIFILGAPGVGKGTQSTFLKAKIPGLTHLSYGDLVRYHDGIPGSWISSFPRRMDNNNPNLPADAVVALLRGAIEKGFRQHGQRVWLVDGFPRREDHVAEWLKQLPRPVCTLYLYCPSNVSSDRVGGRAATSGRPDDANRDKVEERIERNLTDAPRMLDALEREGIPVIRINTHKDVEIVKKEVLGCVQGAMKAWEEGHSK